MAGQNTYLASVVKTLAAATPKHFAEFWKAVDIAAGLTTPSTPVSEVGLGALVGRPLALTQISVMLEMQGYPTYNLGWDTIDQDNTTFMQTDNGLSQVQFPVVIGDIDAIDDGLIGYFKQDGENDYDYATFYSESATAGGSGVIKPDATTLLVTPHTDTQGKPASITEGQQKVLMLVDPRAGIHLSSGILPTQYLQIPAHQYLDIMRSLEMAFLVAPVFQPASGVALPLGVEKNYIWSWIDESAVNGQSEWLVTPDIQSPTANAVWTYTPQQISEGWLRLNPLVLRFSLLTNDGKPTVTAGATVNLSLTVTNLLNENITFEPAQIVNEGQATEGSIIYIHFINLVKNADIPKIKLSAAGWAFKALNDNHYGNYWAATTLQNKPVSIAAKQSLSVAIKGVAVSNTANGQCKVYFDYYKVTGAGGNGVAAAALGIESSSP